MNRKHAFLIAVLLGIAATAGITAATRSVDVGAAAATPRAPDAAIAGRSAKLDRQERSLRKALARRPPKLPAVPKASRRQGGSAISATQAVSAASSSAQAPSVVYKQTTTPASAPTYESDDDAFEDDDEAEPESDD